MIGITNPPGRFILQVAHDGVFVDLLWRADSVVTGGAGMSDADEVQGSTRFLQSKKSLHGFVTEAFYGEAPM